eukprot:6617877-Prymnesium_polylepis.2
MNEGLSPGACPVPRPPGACPVPRPPGACPMPRPAPGSILPPAHARRVDHPASAPRPWLGLNRALVQTKACQGRQGRRSRPSQGRPPVTSARSDGPARIPCSEGEANVHERNDGGGGGGGPHIKPVVVHLANHATSLLDEAPPRARALRALPALAELLKRGLGSRLVDVAAVSADPLSRPVAKLLQRRLFLRAPELHGHRGCARRSLLHAQLRSRQAEGVREAASGKKQENGAHADDCTGGWRMVGVGARQGCGASWRGQGRQTLAISGMSGKGRSIRTTPWILKLSYGGSSLLRLTGGPAEATTSLRFAPNK